MKNLIGILRTILWMAVFLFPFVILFWMWFVAPRKLEQWTGLTDWIGAVLCVIVGMVLAGIYIVTVWPRLIRFSSPQSGSPFVATHSDAAAADNTTKE